MSVSLVIMAAGLGSRYGGSKQVDGIGPNGEILMEYSIHDALRAGFDKVVFIIKPEMREKIRQVMRFSGPRMLLYHPVLAVWHLICSKREKRRESKK